MKKILLLMSLISALQSDILESGKGLVSLKGGLVSAQGPDDYYIGGAEIAWLVLDGLKLGFGYERWFNHKPNLDKLSINATYYLPVSEKVRPYIGGFLATNYLDSIYAGTSQGAKIGILFSSEVAAIGLEWNHEFFQRDLTSFDRGYPMVVLGIGF